MKNFLILLHRELCLILKNTRILFSFSSFFLISLLLFVFAIGTDLQKLSSLFVPILWMIIIFSIILISESFVLEDFSDGSLSELQTMGYSEELIFLSKSSAMFFSLLLPNMFLVPIASLLFRISLVDALEIILIVLIALPTLVLISILSALISLQVRKNKFIQFILIMPFLVPVLIFSTSSNSFLNYTDSQFKILILIGLFLITLPVTVFFGKLVIKELNY